MEENADKVKLW